MRITVIAADASHLIHAGGEVERITRTFDAPPEMAEFIEAFRLNNSYASISLAVEEATPPKDPTNEQ